MITPAILNQPCLPHATKTRITLSILLYQQALTLHPRLAVIGGETLGAVDVRTFPLHVVRDVDVARRNERVCQERASEPTDQPSQI